MPVGRGPLSVHQKSTEGLTVEQDRRLVEQALDLLVYAPVGLALEAKEMMPKLVERGRGQVALTRLAGRVAAKRGREEIERVLGWLYPPADGAEAEGAGGVDAPAVIAAEDKA